MNKRATSTADVHEDVSFETESLILVDEQDRITGYKSKAECHDGDGILHRAFSLFIFNADGDVLLQKRSGQKRLWPLFWSNSVCSHPRAGETMNDAAGRRLYQELGTTGELHYLFKFQYQAGFEDKGSENELCWVYIGRADDDIRVNINEIAEWRFVTPDILDGEMLASPETFTPWFKTEWARIRRDHWSQVRALNSAEKRN